MLFKIFELLGVNTGPKVDALSKWENLPVLPNEASDLATHVDQCAKRYNALSNALHLLISQTSRALLLALVFRIFMVFMLYKISVATGVNL